MDAADRIPVLMYHRIGEIYHPAERRYCVTPDRFDAQMSFLARRGYRAVPIEALVAWLENGSPLCEGDFVLTFDDGYKGVLDYAAPVLDRLNWPFTVFLVTDLLGQCDAWPRNDGSDSAAHPLLTADDVVSMAARGVSFHSHTCRHRSLRTLDDDTLRHELMASRDALRQLLGTGDHYIAYPYGHVDDRVARAARESGYTAGFSVRSGFNRTDVDRFRIRRLDVAGTDTPAALLRKMKMGSNDGSRRAALRYMTQRLADRLRFHTA
ncbi:MAG TPA: polysaccharide deacetylase family protein [Rubrivivax sp.]|nr:polysaccharide deacetylase family protein [Rubrivivax sp.]